MLTAARLRLGSMEIAGFLSPKPVFVWAFGARIAPPHRETAQRPVRWPC